MVLSNSLFTVLGLKNGWFGAIGTVKVPILIRMWIIILIHLLSRLPGNVLQKI